MTIRGCLSFVLLLAAFASAGAEEPPRKINIAILLFQGVQTIDYAGPMEVFSQAGTKTNVYTVGESLDPVPTASGLVVVPKYTLTNAPKPDWLVLPGGGSYKKGRSGVGDQLDKPAVMGWITETAREAKVLTVCNGAFFAAKAGLLNNLPATTFYGMLGNLQEVSPTTKPIYDKRYIDNGNIITTAGLSSGMDGSLYVISKIFGMQEARRIALNMEYNWDPNSTYARAAFGDMNIPGSFYTALPKDAKNVSWAGGADQWTEVYDISSELPVETVFRQVNESLSKDTRWTSLPHSGSTMVSRWNVGDHMGKTWKGSISIKPDQAQRNLLTIQLNRVAK